MDEFNLSCFWWVFGGIVSAVIIMIAWGFITLWRVRRNNKEGKDERDR